MIKLQQFYQQLINYGFFNTKNFYGYRLNRIDLSFSIKYKKQHYIIDIYYFLSSNLLQVRIEYFYNGFYKRKKRFNLNE